MNQIKKYINEVLVEIKKVSWPTRKQTLDKTLLVVVVSVITAAYIGGLDYVFQQLMETLIGR